MIGPMRMRGGFVVSAALAGISIFHAAGGWHYLRSNHPADAAAIARLARLAAPEVVLFDASVPADFISSLHRANTGRRFVMLGGSSAAARSEASVGVEDLASSMDQVRDAMTRNDVKYIVVSDLAPHSEAESSLRAILRSDARFKLLGTFPVQSSDADRQAGNVYLYENGEGVTSAKNFVPVRRVILRADQAVQPTLTASIASAQ
jgi:hypothetical protein